MAQDAQLVLGDDLEDPLAGPGGDPLHGLIGSAGIQHQHLHVLVLGAEDVRVMVQHGRIDRLVAQRDREDPVGQTGGTLRRRLAHGGIRIEREHVERRRHLLRSHGDQRLGSHHPQRRRRLRIDVLLEVRRERGEWNGARRCVGGLGFAHESCSLSPRPGREDPVGRAWRTSR